METNAINTASSVVQQQTYSGRSPNQSVERSNQNDTAAKAAQAREAQAAQQAQKAQQAQAQQQAQQTQRPEPPKPVINAQGQKTGTIVNTSA